MKYTITVGGKGWIVFGGTTQLTRKAYKAGERLDYSTAMRNSDDMFISIGGLDTIVDVVDSNGISVFKSSVADIKRDIANWMPDGEHIDIRYHTAYVFKTPIESDTLYVETIDCKKFDPKKLLQITRSVSIFGYDDEDEDRCLTYVVGFEYDKKVIRHEFDIPDRIDKQAADSEVEYFFEIRPRK